MQRERLQRMPLRKRSCNWPMFSLPVVLVAITYLFEFMKVGIIRIVRVVLRNHKVIEIINQVSVKG